MPLARQRHDRLSFHRHCRKPRLPLLQPLLPLLLLVWLQVCHQQQRSQAGQCSLGAEGHVATASGSSCWRRPPGAVSAAAHNFTACPHMIGRSHSCRPATRLAAAVTLLLLLWPLHAAALPAAVTVAGTSVMVGVAVPPRREHALPPPLQALVVTAVRRRRPQAGWGRWRVHSAGLAAHTGAVLPSQPARRHHARLCSPPRPASLTCTVSS